jgi:ATP-dependent DNA helicase 2 subunit 1
LQWHYRILQALALEEEVPEKAEDATEPKYKAISKRAGGYLEDWTTMLEDEATKAQNKRAMKREPDDELPQRPAKRSRAGSEKPGNSSISDAQLRESIESGSIAKMTVAQLKDILGAKGISTAGRKIELIERLEQYMEEK